MTKLKKAVVVGALGVIGRYVVDELLADPSWQVIGLSRRDAPAKDRYTHISVDLLDLDQCKKQLQPLNDITHIFFAGFTAGTGAAANYAKVIEPNRDLLVNSVSAISEQSSELKRVVLVTGTKYYGTHLGPVNTPIRETDARHLPPNYYFDQIDWLTDFQKGKSWDWVELRPQTLCGFAPGTAMSIMPAIAVYASVCKELGQPLRFPGKPGAWKSLYQVTDSAHFARATHWAAKSPACTNQAYNVTNGDVFRWYQLWPMIADVFEMKTGEPQQISLTTHMADKADLWQQLQDKYGLKPIAYEQLAAWPFADYVFGTDWDVMSSLTKLRRAGFHEIIDSHEMFESLLRRFRDEQIVP